MVSQEHDSQAFVHIPFVELRSTLENILLRRDFPVEQAALCAEVFAVNSLEGVYSHGVNRFAKFVEYVKKGYVRPGKQAIRIHSARAIEQWDGQSGPGPVNAFVAVDRAIQLASLYGMGCVALANTNHWMRGGTYAWKAARAGFAYIGWSNTVANMPPWGAIEPKLGNNPLIIGVPGPSNTDTSSSYDAIVLDMAMSLYSFGAMEVRAQKGEQLPYPGGYDLEGNLTTDPVAIMKSLRPLPIGYWKGSGLSLLLDLLAAILSGGSSTAAITANGVERNLSQIFIAIDLSQLHNYSAIGTSVRRIVDDYLSATPASDLDRIRYPGESAMRTRSQNLANGVPVWRGTWEGIQALMA